MTPLASLTETCAHQWSPVRDEHTSDLLLICTRCGGWLNWSLARRHHDEQGRKKS